jgi:hypothetical protein
MEIWQVAASEIAAEKSAVPFHLSLNVADLARSVEFFRPMLNGIRWVGCAASSMPKSAANFGHNHRQRSMSPLTILNGAFRPC